MNINMIKYLVIAASILMSWQVMAEVVERAGAPSNSHGKTISCHNPRRNLGIVRTPEQTTVFQTSPHGVEWRYSVPAMEFKSDRYYLAPNGSAAVIGVSPVSTFLVTEKLGPLEIKGALLGADFQQGQVLIATALESNSRSAEGNAEAISGIRVRVLDLHSGALLSDTEFTDVVPAIDSEFLVRLSGDGEFYYYIRRADRGNEVPVLRDIASGVEEVLDVPIPGFIDDIMMYTRRDGYVVIDERIYSINPDGIVPIPSSNKVGGVYRLVESDDRSIQAVEGREGWGVFDTATLDWVLTGEGSSISFIGSRLTVVDVSVDSRGIRSFDFSGVKPRLIRSDRPGKALNGRTLVCANEFGFMSVEPTGLRWHRGL